MLGINQVTAAPRDGARWGVQPAMYVQVCMHCCVRCAVRCGQVKYLVEVFLELNEIVFGPIDGLQVLAEHSGFAAAAEAAVRKSRGKVRSSRSNTPLQEKI